MAEDRRRSGRALVVVTLAVAVLLPLAAVTLEVSPRRFTSGTAVIVPLLVIGAISLPALLFARWRAADRANRDR